MVKLWCIMTYYGDIMVYLRDVRGSREMENIGQSIWGFKKWLDIFVILKLGMNFCLLICLRVKKADTIIG